MLINLALVQSLRELIPASVAPAVTAGDAEHLSALQAIHPRVAISATAKGVTVKGQSGQQQLRYPFMNDLFFIAATEL